MNLNIVDIVIVLSLLMAAFDGWRRGAIIVALELLVFGVAIGTAFLLYGSVGSVFIQFGLRPSLSSIIGFITVLGIVEAVFRLALGLVGRIVSKLIRLGVLGSAIGGGLSALKQGVLLAIFINLLLFLPVIPQVRSTIQSSRLAPMFELKILSLEQAFSAMITPAIEELQSMTTVVKISDSPLTIDTPIQSLAVDNRAEQELFRLVNEERQQQGLIELTWSDKLADVGRAHSKDMWQRQYFAHVNPDEKTPFDRIDAVGITYRDAGENLALAPTTPIAHKGLMDSPGHRANILKPEYRQLGVGSVRNGLYGVMYTQLFSN